MQTRSFKIDQQWQMIHEPDRPNGFGLLIIGDVNNYVNEYQSLWTQNEQRLNLLSNLVEQGYTVFYSNLMGRQWGSPDAVNFISKIFKWVSKDCTLNPNYHILAEGTGAITALMLTQQHPSSVRSLAFINPCLDLEQQLNHAKKSRLLYDSLETEIADAYYVEHYEGLHKLIREERNLQDYDQYHPIAIWHDIRHFHYPIDIHSRNFEKICKEKNIPLELKISMDDQPFAREEGLKHFFNKHESVLN